MRSIWKGSLSFGLVNVPVKLYSATEDHDVPLHQVHDEDGGRIRYKRTCEVCGKTVDYEHIAKAYVLLRQTLKDSDRTAIVKFALRQKTRLAALRVRDDVLLLQTLLWEDEVREARFPELDEVPCISQDELTMSRQLVESFASDFTPEKFSDDYQEPLKTLVEAKLEQGDALDTEATFGRQAEAGGEVLDLMEALRRSVESKRAAAPEKLAKPAAKKPAAKKQSA